MVETIQIITPDGCLDKAIEKIASQPKNSRIEPIEVEVKNGSTMSDSPLPRAPRSPMS